jgi:hypothetical protein
MMHDEWGGMGGGGGMQQMHE